MLYLSDAKGQCVPRDAPSVLLRLTSEKLSHLTLKEHRNLFVGLKASFSRESVQNSSCALLLHASNSGTTRAHAHTYSCGATAPPRGHQGALGVRRARTGGGIRAWFLGWTRAGVNGRLFCGKSSRIHGFIWHFRRPVSQFFPRHPHLMR